MCNVKSMSLVTKSELSRFVGFPKGSVNATPREWVVLFVVSLAPMSLVVLQERIGWSRTDFSRTATWRLLVVPKGGLRSLYPRVGRETKQGPSGGESRNPWFLVNQGVKQPMISLAKSGDGCKVEEYLQFGKKA